MATPNSPTTKPVPLLLGACAVLAALLGVLIYTISGMLSAEQAAVDAPEALQGELLIAPAPPRTAEPTVAEAGVTTLPKTAISGSAAAGAGAVPVPADPSAASWQRSTDLAAQMAAVVEKAGIDVDPGSLPAYPAIGPGGGAPSIDAAFGANALPGMTGEQEERLRAAIDELPSLPAPEVKKPGFEGVSFTSLAGFKYTIPGFDETLGEGEPAGSIEKQIPEAIRALHGKQVAVMGYMVPLDIELDGIKRFLLVRNQMLCCFGLMPRLNEWIDVKMDEGRIADYFSDLPVVVYGKFEVGEEVEQGIVLSIFRMQASEAVGADE